jgi:hypothetical protein
MTTQVVRGFVWESQGSHTQNKYAQVEIRDLEGSVGVKPMMQVPRTQVFKKFVQTSFLYLLHHVLIQLVLHKEYTLFLPVTNPQRFH